MKSLIISMVAFSLFSSGCATMFNGSNAMVTVRTEEPGTKIYVDESYVGSGSAVVSVTKKGSHSIRVAKEGCSDNTQAIGKQFDPTSMLGILLDFGIVSMLLVDGAATGAISDIHPRNYVVNPVCSSKGHSPASTQE